MPLKKILLITFEFPPYLGGAGVYAHDTAIGLSKNNCKVDVLTYQHVGIEKIQSRFKDTYGITIRTFKPISGLHFVQFPNQMRKVLKKTDYDLVILNDNRAKTAFTLLKSVLKLHTAKVVGICHGNELNAFFKSPSLALRLSRVHKKFYAVLHSLHKIITVSKNEYRLWANAYPEFETKLALVAHGVSEDIFFRRTAAEKTDLKQKLKIPENKRILFSASRLVQPKGQDVLIKAFSQLYNSNKDMQLYIAGDGPYAEELKQLAIDLGVKDEVVFLGALEREQLSQYYAVADLFVLVSRFEEAFGLVYLEAAACGLPCISGTSGGVTDVVLNGTNGYCINPENPEELAAKLAQLLEDKALYGRLATAAYQLYKENYTCQQSALRLLQACEMHNTQEAAVCY